MRKNNSKDYSTHQRNDSGSLDKDSAKSFQTKNLSISPLSLNTLGSNTTHYMDPEFEPLSQKQSRGQSTGTSYENQYFRLSNEIREVYMDIKERAVRDDPNCALILKKIVPLDQDDISQNGDPMAVLHYIKKVFDKMMEFKDEAENELNARNKGECSDYEGMLQKLEAEVRQHIRIEQQLKLYVESTQAKLDEIEKVYDPVKAETMKKELEDLKNENSAYHDKVKRRDNEIEQYKKEINNKNSFIKDLEHQVENLPALKNRIRDLEKMLNSSGNKPPSSNALRGSNKYNRENEPVDRNQSFANHYSSGDHKRKSSQPSLNVSSYYEVPKQKHHDKENVETYKIDLGKHMHDNFKGYRSNSQSEVQKTTENSRLDTSMLKNSLKQNEKEDFSSVLEKMKKTLRSHSRNTSKENLRSSDQSHQTINPEEILENDAKAFESKKGRTGESSKYSIYDKKMKSGTYSQAFNGKSWDKEEYKDSKEMHNKSSYYKESVETEHNQRNSIPRPRPSTGHHNDSSYLDYNKYKKEQEAYDLNKLKASSPKKISQDRSMSVDAKTKLYKQTKSRDETLDKTVDYDGGRPSIGSYNNYVSGHHQNRKIIS